MDSAEPVYFMPHTAANVRRRVNYLRNINLEQYAIERNFHKEVEKLKAAYELKYQPFYKKRLDVLQGLVEPTDDQCTVEEEKDEHGHGEGIWTDFLDPETPASADYNGIPDFWLTVLSRCEETSVMIQEHDVPLLQKVTDITSEVVGDVDGDKYGFKIVFKFAPNEYISNAELSRNFYFTTDKYNPSYLFDSSDAGKVSWLPGKDLTKEIIQKKQRNKKTGAVRNVSQTVSRPSFFDFFFPVDIETLVDNSPEDMDMDALESLVSASYEAGEAIREKVVPRAVFIYTGEAGEKDFGDEEYSDNGEYGSHDDDSENNESQENNSDDSEDDSDSEVEKPLKKTSPVSSTQDAKASDCKQQ